MISIKYFWTFGSIFIAGLAWACLGGGSSDWKALSVFAALPVAVSLGVSVLLLPESPRWLLCRGRGAEAEAVVRAAAAVNGTVLAPFSLKPYSDGSDGSDSHSHSQAADNNTWAILLMSMLQLFHRKNLKISIPLWTIWFCIGVGYYGVVLLISRVFSASANDDNDAATSSFTCDFRYKEIFIGTLFEVVGVFLASCLIDRLGRKGTADIWHVFGLLNL